MSKPRIADFIEAARLLAHGNEALCCTALNRVWGDRGFRGWPARDAFRRLYNPAYDRGVIWFGKPSARNQRTRILALLLAAEFYSSKSPCKKRSR